MLALLLAVALIGLTALTLLLVGALIAIVTGVLVLNACLLVLALRRSPGRRRDGARPELAERWRPSSFRRPPEPPTESESESESEAAPTLKAYRL